MKKSILITLMLIASFGLGFAFNALLSKQRLSVDKLKKVTGIGGVFFKCKNPKKMREWYKTHLGLNTNPYGTVFEWRQASDSTKKGYTQWSPFKDSTKYFEPSERGFMINYRVADLVFLVAELKKENISITDTIETYEYGKFVHILDLEGNKIELWEPNDIAYEKLSKKMGIQTTR
jgi:predicted enzyme related to lactoylglutathione lyase